MCARGVPNLRICGFGMWCSWDVMDDGWKERRSLFFPSIRDGRWKVNLEAGRKKTQLTWDGRDLKGSGGVIENAQHVL